MVKLEMLLVTIKQLVGVLHILVLRHIVVIIQSEQERVLHVRLIPFRAVAQIQVQQVIVKVAQLQHHLVLIGHMMV